MPAVDIFELTYPAIEQVTRAVKKDSLAISIIGTSGALYYFKAYDSGTAGYVVWGPYNETTGHSSPSASETTPNYTGTLSNIHIYLIRR